MSENCFIRPAQLADVDVLYHLQLEAYGELEATPRAILEGLLKQEARFQRLRCFVLQEDQNILGYIVVEDLEHITIADVVVRPPQRGQGHGERLIRHILESGRLHILSVKESNQRAQALYRKLGFAEIQRLEKYYKDGSDALILALTPL